MNKTLKERFEKKYKKCSNGCWIWMGCKIKEKYGQIRTEKNKRMLAHRVSWILYRGKITDNLFVLHKCDNPPCVNPEHLFLGTHQDNMDDMIRKSIGKTTRNTGESHGNSFLKENDIRAIRLMRKLGTKQNSIADYFNVTQGTISSIIRRRTWSHIE